MICDNDRCHHSSTKFVRLIKDNFIIGIGYICPDCGTWNYYKDYRSKPFEILGVASAVIPPEEVITSPNSKSPEIDVMAKEKAFLNNLSFKELHRGLCSKGFPFQPEWKKVLVEAEYFARKSKM